MRGPGLARGSSGHVERCAVLLHLVDGAAGDVVRAWRTVREELAAYGGGLADKPELIGLNKADAMTPREASARQGGAGEGVRAAGDAAVRRHRPGRAGGAAGVAGMIGARDRRRGRSKWAGKTSPSPCGRGLGGGGRAASHDPLPPTPSRKGRGRIRYDPLHRLRPARGGEDRQRPGGGPGRGSPPHRLARRRGRRHRLAARARRRRDRGFLRRHRARPPLARPAPAPPPAGGTAGRRRRRPDPPGAGLERGALRQGPHRRATAADARRHRGPPPLPERPRHAEHAARPRLHPGDQRERHGGDRGDPLRRQRPPRRARRRDDAGRPADPAVRHRRALHRRPAPRSRRRAHARRPDHHRRDRGDGWRAAARLFLRRHAHQAGGGADRHAGRLRDGDRLWPHGPPARRAGEGRALHLVPGRRRKAAPPASVGSPARWRRSVRWWWTPGRRAHLSAGRSLLPAGVRGVEGAFERGDPVVVRNGDGKALARGLSRLCQRRGRHASPAIAPTRSRPSWAGAAATRSSTATTWCCFERHGNGRLARRFVHDAHRNRGHPASATRRDGRARCLARAGAAARRRAQCRAASDGGQRCGRRPRTSWPPTPPTSPPAPAPPHSAIGLR